MCRCLWELYCCHEGKARLSVCLDRDDEALFLKELQQDANSGNVLAKMFTGLDSSKAQATRESDTRKIGAEIKRKVGFLKLDAIVLEQLKGWLLHVATAETWLPHLGYCGKNSATAGSPAEAEAEQVSVVQSEVVLCVNQLPHQDVEQ